MTLDFLQMVRLGLHKFAIQIFKYGALFYENETSLFCKTCPAKSRSSMAWGFCQAMLSSHVR